MIAPHELKNKTFSRVVRGYNPLEVDEYFDFLIENTYLIEYDGEQHYFGWSYDIEDLKIQQQRDEYKNQWCKDNNIPLIRIPYTKLDTLCIEDLMLETTQFRVV